MNTSEVLYKAADLIEERGWWSASGGCTGTAPACAANAILRFARETVGNDAAAVPGFRALYTYLGGESLSVIWHWNDHPDRTKAEVIETLRAAAVIEAAKENAAALEPQSNEVSS